MKINPAHKGSKAVPPPGQVLEDIGMCRLVIGMLLHRLGGEQVVVFDQAEMDRLTGLLVLEGRTKSGDLILGLGAPRTPKEKQQ